jgi:two-component system response regulator YesN
LFFIGGILLFKLLVVDSEIMVRKGLERIINWKQLGCKMVGEAGNGEDALQKMKSLKPDIIITEFNLPNGNGLEFIEKTFEYLPECKIIVFTSIKEFNLVLSAMKLGILDILLKPTKLEEINKILYKAIKKLKLEKDREDEVLKLRKIFDENVPELREKLLHDIIYNLSSKEIDLKEKMKIFNMKIDKFILVLANLDYSSKNDYIYFNSHQNEIINIFIKLLSKKFEMYKVLLSNKQIVFLIQGLEKYEDYIDVIYGKCESIYNIVKNCFSFDITISISDDGHGVEDLPKKYNICSDIMRYKNYIGDDAVISFKESYSKIKDYSKFDKIIESILENIKNGNEQFISKYIEEFIYNISSLHEKSISDKKKYYFRLIETIYDLEVKDVFVDKSNLFKQNERTESLIIIEECDKDDEIKNIIVDIAIMLSKKINSYNKKKVKLSLKKAIDFINENYSKQITLNQVAEHIYLSPYYISRLFKKELGKNFSEFLIEVRIEKAKELLKDIQYKIYEIAELVGIQDAHYFSRIFKKYVNLSPSEYRDMNIKTN